MQLQEYIAANKLVKYVEDVNHPEKVLNRIRLAISVIKYLNHHGTPHINSRLTNIINDVHAQWLYGETVWNGNNPGNHVRIAAFWREWTEHFFSTRVIAHTREKTVKYIAEMRKFWATMEGEKALQVMEILQTLEGELVGLSIDTSGFP